MSRLKPIYTPLRPREVYSQCVAKGYSEGSPHWHLTSRDQSLNVIEIKLEGKMMRIL